MLGAYERLNEFVRGEPDLVEDEVVICCTRDTALYFFQ